MNRTKGATLACTITLGFLLMLPGLIGSAQATGITTYADRNTFDLNFSTSDKEGWDIYSDKHQFNNGGSTNGITYQTNGANAIVTAFYQPSSPSNSLGMYHPDEVIPGSGPQTDSSAYTPDTIFRNDYFDGTNTITFTFQTHITTFGIDINTASENAGEYTATFDGGTTFIYSTYNPFPNQTTGQFIGFSSDTAFSSVTIAPKDTSIYQYTLDTMRYGHTYGNVPEPSSLLLLGSAFMGLAVWRLKEAARGS